MLSTGVSVMADFVDIVGEESLEQEERRVNYLDIVD